MGKISVLDERVINHIAAGEVVENSASIVKELVENSIDAGSTSITVEFAKGGIELLRISDNGSGMDEEDAKAAFIRHATSKVRSVEDLNHIATMGFRGEALASIAEVSEVEMTTSTGDIGTVVLMRGGKCENIRQIGFPKGTSIEVRNLFYNTPARKKFLKSVRQETAAVLELCSRLIMSHPEIAFKVINSGRMELRSRGSGERLDAIAAIYGPGIKSELAEVSGTFGTISLHGYVTTPAYARLNRRAQTFFVNGRYIKNNIISGALDDAFKPYLMQNKYPLAVLFLELPAEEVDVNVHPQKTEVRFGNTRAVFDAVSNIVSQAIRPESVFPELELEKEEIAVPSEHFASAPPAEPVTITVTDKFDDDEADTKVESPIKTPQQAAAALQQKIDQAVNRVSKDNKADFVKEGRAVVEQPQQPLEKKPKPEPIIMQRETPSVESVQAKPNPAIQELKEQVVKKQFAFDRAFPEYDPEAKPKMEFQVCGVLWDTYIVVQAENLCYIIDQHAAHERILYDKYLAEYREKKIVIQELLVPEILEAEPFVIDFIGEHIEAFASAGFEIELFGQNSCIIRGVPSILCGASFSTVFEEVVEEMERSGSGKKVIDDIVIETLMQTSCKHAVKGNQKLSDSEIQFILEGFAGGQKFTCPHGRPIAVTMTKRELERRFGRIQ